MTFTPEEIAAGRQWKAAQARQRKEARRQARERAPLKADRGRVHDRAHLAFIRRLPCVCCGAAAPNDAAHLRMAAADRGKPHTGMGRKPDDCWTLPACRTCHERQHSGSEARFWSDLGIDPITLCRDLYAVSGNYEAGLRIIKSAGRRG